MKYSFVDGSEDNNLWEMKDLSDEGNLYSARSR